MIRARSFLFLIILAAVAIIGVLINLPIEDETVPAQVTQNLFEDSVGVDSPPIPEVTRDPFNNAGEPESVLDKTGDLDDEDSGRDVQQEVRSQEWLAQITPPTETAGVHLPFMIRWSNWRLEFGPAIVYAREPDLRGMLQMQGPVEKMLMVTSFAEVERLMARAEELRTAGVTTVGFNTESGPEITPAVEMQTIDNPDPNVNVVARVAKLVTQNGFNVIWGPVRLTADNVSDEAIRTMIEAGVRGLALQEQKFIEFQPAQARLAEVNQTRERYLQLAQEQGVEEFEFHVQVMHQRCPDLSNCVAFVQGLEDIPVDSIAIWSIGPIPLDFIGAIRHY